MLARGGSDLVDRFQHGRSLNPFDPEAQQDYFKIAAGLGGTVGEVGRMTGMPVLADLGDRAMVGVAGAQTATDAKQLYDDWDTLPPEQRLDRTAKLGLDVGLLRRGNERENGLPGQSRSEIGSAENPGGGVAANAVNPPRRSGAGDSGDLGASGAARDSTKTDRLKEHLTSRDLDAARRELGGEVVARKGDGTPWDHVNEVREAQTGLTNRIAQLKRQMGDSRSSPTDRAAAQAELSEASKMLDESEKYVPRSPNG
jgi:hypothetical protein